MQRVEEGNRNRRAPTVTVRVAAPRRCWGRGSQQPLEGPRGLRAPTGIEQTAWTVRAVPARTEEEGRPQPRNGGAAARLSSAPDYNSQRTPPRQTTASGRPRAGPPSRHCACATVAGRGWGMRGGGSAVIGGARREGGVAAAILGAGQ